MTKATRKKASRVLTVTPKPDTVRARGGRSTDIQEHAPRTAGEPQMMAMALALSLAEVAALRAAEREQSPSTEETRGKRRSAERRLRRQRAALVRSIGRVPTTALVQALTIDGGVMLRVAASAAPALREHAIWAAVQGASVAIQRGLTDTASLTMLCASFQWRAIETALLARAFREDAPRDVLKLASLANANARHSLLTADHLSRSGGKPVVQPPAPLDHDAREREMQAHALEMERAAGRTWDDEDESDGG